MSMCVSGSVLQSRSDSELSLLALLPFTQEKCVVVGQVNSLKGNVPFLRVLPPIQGRSEFRLNWSLAVTRLQRPLVVFIRLELCVNCEDKRQQSLRHVPLTH